MSEILDTPVTLVLGGREWTLRFTNRSARAVDKAGGREKSLYQGGIFDEDVTPEATALLLWGAMLPDAPDITREQVEEMVLDEHPSRVRELVTAACKAWIGERKPKEQTEPPPAAPPSNP